MARPRKNTARTFAVPQLSANPTDRLGELNELIERTKAEMKSAVIEARDNGVSWIELSRTTGIAQSSLRRIGGFWVDKPRDEAPVKATKSTRATKAPKTTKAPKATKSPAKVAASTKRTARVVAPAKAAPAKRGRKANVA